MLDFKAKYLLSSLFKKKKRFHLRQNKSQFLTKKKKTKLRLVLYCSSSCDGK